MKEASEKGKSQSPVPSITLQITKRDGERFLEASEALGISLSNTRKGAAAEDSSSSASNNIMALHEMLYSAAQQCHHPLITQFLDRVSSLDETEVKGAILLFHESDKTAKLRQLFDILSTSSDSQLDRNGAISLFRTILLAISSCLQNTPEQNHGKDVIVEGKPTATSPERPTKRVKHHHHKEDATLSTKAESDDDSRVPCQSPSWDSSLATLRDEEDKEASHGVSATIRKEIEEIATYAANQLLKFAANTKETNLSEAVVDFGTFGEWYNSSGSSIVPWIELLQLSKWKAPAKKPPNNSSSGSANVKTTKPALAPTKSAEEQPDSTSSSPGSLMNEEDKSRTLVSFDFNGSGSPTPLLINITEDNLFALQALVQRTNLMQRTPNDICKVLMHSACHRNVNGQDTMILKREDFRRTIRMIVPEYVYAQLSKEEKEAFNEAFFDFFFCFEESKSVLHSGEVDLKEFAVGFCFFCSGNKSTKLATGYELLDSGRRGYLTEDQLLRYLQSYLTMLVAMSLLIPIPKRQRRRPLSVEGRKALRLAVENGAKWTLGHFLKASGQTKNEYTFECFATWYSNGGYNVAPWLELLDLNKVMSLITEPSVHEELPPINNGRGFVTTGRRTAARDRVSSLRRHHQSRQGFPPEILFTFPLGNRRSLVVLKEDATYVRSVTEQLGLLSMKPDDVWSALSRAVEKRRKPVAPNEVALYVNMETFVQSMQEICPRPNRKRSAPGTSGPYSTSSSLEELLSNFFQCFDIDQCDSVALDELMGGLTLLCGGKKSTKLAFAFSIFDTRPGAHGPGKKRNVTHSLSGEDLFLFLRSILIVTFSTCRQSLDLTDEMVGRCIADTANMICNDVMRHQWETKHLDRLDFDEFGQWYNDGGFERAPWLELLDLKKWVLVDNFDTVEKQVAPAPPPRHAPAPPIASVPSREMPVLPPVDTSIPPAPPEDALDHSFFDTDAIMQMDSMDDMDMILMQPSHDKDDFPKINKSFSYSPREQHQHQRPPERRGNPLKFHLNTSDEHGGYMLSLSQARIRHFRKILEASGLHKIDAETACNHILKKGSNSMITKKEFNEALQNILSSSKHDRNTDRTISDVFSGIFAAFDRDGTGKASALEVACGFTVLCRGKKSDKLEFAFEVLDKNKRGRLSRADMASYLKSFLTVLLSVAFAPSLDNDPAEDTLSTMNGMRCDRATATLIRAVKAGADWAASLAFRDFDRNKKQAPSMSFDDFADWYTAVGYSSIPWLELLDLQKWAK